MGRGTFRGAGGDENLKIDFMWPNRVCFFLLLSPSSGCSFNEHVKNFCTCYTPISLYYRGKDYHPRIQKHCFNIMTLSFSHFFFLQLTL
jgi:hypothetical protein